MFCYIKITEPQPAAAGQIKNNTIIIHSKFITHYLFQHCQNTHAFFNSMYKCARMHIMLSYSNYYFIIIHTAPHSPLTTIKMKSVRKKNV